MALKDVVAGLTPPAGAQTCHAIRGIARGAGVLARPEKERLMDRLLKCLLAGHADERIDT